MEGLSTPTLFPLQLSVLLHASAARTRCGTVSNRGARAIDPHFGMKHVVEAWAYRFDFFVSKAIERDSFYVPRNWGRCQADQRKNIVVLVRTGCNVEYKSWKEN